MPTPADPRRIPPARRAPDATATPPGAPAQRPHQHRRAPTPASAAVPPTWPPAAGNVPDDDAGHSPRYLVGRYRMEAVLGRGAMGTVWAAYDEVVHRRVAIKEIYFPAGMPAGEKANLADRTMREARAIGALSHPHVITLYDILTVEGRPYIVMEQLQARSLSEVIKQNGPQPDAVAATIGVAVAGGLLAAHQAGITHRDVKPGNVLMGDDGRIKLTDFGIARSVDEPTMTVTGLLLGSPAYISPEVAGGQPASPAADAWGLGALLFTAVQGRPPFDRGEPIATLTSVVADPVPPHPRSGRIGAVIDGLLVKDPRDRLSVARAAEMLRPLATDPTSGRPPWALPVPVGPQHHAGQAHHRTGTSHRSSRSGPPIPAAGRSDPLPPPPWEDRQAASLPALPPPDARGRRGWVVAALALLVAVAAATVGFFGVLLVAGWGEDSVTGGASGSGSAIVVTGSVTSPSPNGQPTL